MGKLGKDFTKLTTFVIGDNVFTGNPSTGEMRRCSVSEYNANVADITPSGATPDLTDGIFTFDATTKAWSKVTINEFITNLNNKTTVNASPDIADSMLVIDDSTNALERLTIQQFLTRLGTTVTENTTPSLTDGVYVFDGSTKALERLTINQLLTAVATNATENTTPDLADGIFVLDNSTKAWERLSLTQLFTRLGLNVTIGSGTTFADPIIVDDETDSSASTNGSIQTDGGAGITKSLFVGENITALGSISCNKGEWTTSTSNPDTLEVIASVDIPNDSIYRGVVSSKNGNNIQEVLIIVSASGSITISETYNTGGSLLTWVDDSGDLKLQKTGGSAIATLFSITKLA